jgi:hypothetical protein
VKATQAIHVGKHAPVNAVYGQQFTVAATGGGSGNGVDYGASGVCSNTGAAYTIAGVGTCSVAYHQAGDSNYKAAPAVHDFVRVKPALTLRTFTTTCRGTYSGTGASVLVPSGATCGLMPGSHVTNSITVMGGGTLYVTGARIGGTLSSSGSVTVCGSKIGRDLIATGGLLRLGGPGCAGSTIAGKRAHEGPLQGRRPRWRKDHGRPYGPGRHGRSHLDRR